MNDVPLIVFERHFDYCKIFYFLEPKVLLSVAIVSKYWAKVVFSEKTWESIVDQLDKTLCFYEFPVPPWIIYRDSTNIYYHAKHYITQYQKVLQQVKENLHKNPPHTFSATNTNKKENNINKESDKENNNDDKENNNNFYSYPSLLFSPPLMHQLMVAQLCNKTLSILSSEPNILDISAPVTVVEELLTIFAHSGLPPDTSYLFLGDYVSRGLHSVQIVTVLFCLKLLFPDRIFLLRGMHEIQSINRIYGFYDEVKRKYNIKTYKIFSSTFNYLPIAAIIDKKIFAVHSGLGPGELNDLEKLKTIVRFYSPDADDVMINPLCSTPGEAKGFVDNSRGVGYEFGPDVTESFLSKNNFSLLLRSFSAETKGYSWQHDKKVLTIFSAADYGGGFENLGAILQIVNLHELTIVQYGNWNIKSDKKK